MEWSWMVLAPCWSFLLSVTRNARVAGPHGPHLLRRERSGSFQFWNLLDTRKPGTQEVSFGGFSFSSLSRGQLTGFELGFPGEFFNRCSLWFIVWIGSPLQWKQKKSKMTGQATPSSCIYAFRMQKVCVRVIGKPNGTEQDSCQDGIQFKTFKKSRI